MIAIFCTNILQNIQVMPKTKNKHTPRVFQNTFRMSCHDDLINFSLFLYSYFHEQFEIVRSFREPHLLSSVRKTLQKTLRLLNVQSEVKHENKVKTRSH